ncbi:Hsp70 family protein [Pseudovibrio sp. WM33]|uniref:Hsp70 family protein n=1 Tax=Pseudovibrio sp. WM33 TaxID=1735585 RepID=UPI0007AE8F84|nr:Hsp70 family protein [Pseudovibrio sp. WM33]KZL23038.1 Chaperone protein HscC [Pseudovibrio sp. WM33]
MPHIGIDLGTTNSLISVFENGEPHLIKNSLGTYLTPSIVSLDKDTLLTGDLAKARMVTHPLETAAVFKRTMGADKAYKLGKKQFTAVELSAAVLRSLKEDAQNELKAEISDVVISVPAYFNELQRKAVRSAAKMAGLNPERLINEPTAAALAYGFQSLEEESSFLVFDLGGGTFDVSIMEVFEGVMEVKATSGDAYLGGEDFTAALISDLTTKLSPKQQKKPNLEALTKLAEQVKHGLSEKDSVHINLDTPNLTLDHHISRKDFEELATKLTTRLRRPIDRAMYDSGLSADELEKVILVGGATRMPLIRSLVAKHLRQFPESHIDPDHAVALGAAVQAGLIGKNEALKDVVMTDVSAFTLGIETSREFGNNHRAGYYLPLIERNSVVPVSREETIYPVHPQQTKLEIRVFQGEAPDVASNIFLGKLEVELPRQVDQDLNPATVRFTYDVSGLLEVDVTTHADDKSHSLLIKNLAGEMSDKEISDRLTQLEKLKVHPREDAHNVLLRARIEQCYAMARLGDREQIGEMLHAFDAILTTQNISEISKLSEQISEHLNMFEASYVQ